MSVRSSEWALARLSPPLKMVDLDALDEQDTLGQGRRTGLQLRLTAYAVVTVEDDKIRRIAITADREAALEAAGLAE